MLINVLRAHQQAEHNANSGTLRHQQQIFLGVRVAGGLLRTNADDGGFLRSHRAASQEPSEVGCHSSPWWYTEKVSEDLTQYLDYRSNEAVKLFTRIH